MKTKTVLGIGIPIILCLCMLSLLWLLRNYVTSSVELPEISFSFIKNNYLLRFDNKKNYDTSIIRGDTTTGEADVSELKTPYGKNVASAVQLSDHGWCYIFISKCITAEVFSNEGKRIKEVVLQQVPDQILPFHNGVLFRFGSSLYDWQYNDSDHITIFDRVQIRPDVDEEFRLYTFNNRLVFQEGYRISIFDEATSSLDSVHIKADILGFINEDTLVFRGPINIFGIQYLFKYSISRHKKYDYGLVKGLPISYWFIDAAFSPDSKYMIALASVEFTQRQGVVVDMERYESKLIDYYNDSLGSLQWIE